MPPLLKLKAAAARLNTTPGHVRSLVRDGKLKGINVGRGKYKPRYHIDETDLHEFEQQRRVRQEPKKCLFTSGKGRRTSSSIAGSKVIGLEELRKQRTAAKLKK